MTQQLSELAKTVINNTGLFDGAREFNFEERVTRNGLDLAVRFLGIISSAVPANLQKGFWEAVATYAGDEADTYQ